MIADFENGKLDLALNVPESDYLAANDGAYGSDVQTASYKTWNMQALCLPQYMDCFQDIQVREAISLALDTNAITNAVYGSMGQTADSILIEGCDFYESIGVHEYNPEKSKELLANAGLSDGMELKMVIPSTPVNEKCAEIIQAYLKEVGITLNIESYDFATAIPILMDNGSDICIFGTGGGTYTAAMITKMIGKEASHSGARVVDAEFNQYLDTAISTLDETVLSLIHI